MKKQIIQHDNKEFSRENPKLVVNYESGHVQSNPAINYFSKMLSLRCLTEFWARLSLIVLTHTFPN